MECHNKDSIHVKTLLNMSVGDIFCQLQCVLSLAQKKVVRGKVWFGKVTAYILLEFSALRIYCGTFYLEFPLPRSNPSQIINCCHLNYFKVITQKQVTERDKFWYRQRNCIRYLKNVKTLKKALLSLTTAIFAKEL